MVVCNTGAAQGADAFWSENLAKYNIKSIKWIPSIMSVEDIETGKNEIIKANKILKRNVYKYLNFLSKNWCQVKYSDVIYASGSLTKSGERGYKGFINKSKYTVVEGGTGYAVQMAINNNKPVYFYDQDNDTWMTNVNNEWVSVESVPLITTDFAGIGSTILTEKTKDAIRKLIDDSFNFS